MDPRRLKPIQLLAQEREDAQARQFAQRQKSFDEQRRRLDDLRRYADEYGAPPTGSSTSAALLNNRRAFAEKLDHAVTQQATQVEKARGSCEMERTRLLLASRDVAVLDKLAASYHAEHRKSEDRKSQRELDDHAARVFRRALTE